MSIVTDILNLKNELKASRHHAQELEEKIKALQAEQQRVSHHHPLPRTGIDYAFPPHPPADKLRSAGFSFVGRYLTGLDKALTVGEAKALTLHGVELFAIFEEGERNAEGGYEQGVKDSEVALRALDALHPKGSPPIYFTCDFDAAGEGKVHEVLEYIRGAVHTIGYYRVGLYGGYEVVRQAYAEKRCPFLWQTIAWSHGKWLPEAQLRQLNTIQIFGANVDINKALAADFGQFQV